MNVRIRLENHAGRITAIAAVLAICGGLLFVVLYDFLIGALTDDRISITAGASQASFITAPFTEDRGGINPDVLAAAVRYFPNSALLHFRLGEFEKYQSKDNWSGAELHAIRAVRLSPYDYRPRLLLAWIQEFRQELQAAEESVRAALRLAPGNLEAHWQLGSLLLRRGNLAESLKHFHAAASGHVRYFEEGLKLVWTASGEDTDALRAITPDNAKDNVGLARFLLEQSRPFESAAIFRQIDHDALLGDPESGHYLNSLIAAGHVKLARDLWCALLDRGGETSEENTNLIWNGGFESDILLDFAQFDWSIQPSKYARISIDNKAAHSGRRSLRVDFVGLETTRLEEEIKQLALVRPGARYRLEYYVKTQDLVGPEGPRVVLSGTTSPQWIAASDSAPMDSTDWQHRSLEFIASGSVLTIAVRQQPRFSYEDPTHGTVWFDDFEIREVRRQ